MPSTYTPITSITLGSATASYTISSIPSTYTDLVFVIQSTSSSELQLRFNSDGSGSYSTTEMWGPNGSVPHTQRESGVSQITIRDSNTTLGDNMGIFNIPNYSNTTTNKVILGKTYDGRYGRIYARIGLWRNNAAINAINVISLNGNMNTGSTFTLYGITAA